MLTATRAHQRWSRCLALVLLVAVGLPFHAAAVSPWQLRTLQTRAERDFDLIIFGATGYVGNLLTASLLGDRTEFLSLASGVRLNSGVGKLRFALAGRSELRLRRLRDKYESQGFDVSGVGLITADAADPASLDNMALRAKVVLTTVVESPEEGGGFNANSLIRRCIEHGTHLLDLDGFWFKDDALVRELDALARTTGTVYSPACGEVSVLPDMATYRAWAQLGRPKLLHSVVYHAYTNGTASTQMCLQAWCLPMEAAFWEDLDAPLMRWSANLLAYGSRFGFSEFSPSNLAHVDYLSNKKPAVRKAANFVTAATVEAEDGRKATATVSGGEVDYEETARILIEMAISLLTDNVLAAETGGVWTAAAGWGDALLKRLAAIGLGVTVSEQTALTIIREASEQYGYGYVYEIEDMANETVPMA